MAFRSCGLCPGLRIRCQGVGHGRIELITPHLRLANEFPQCMLRLHTDSARQLCLLGLLIFDLLPGAAAVLHNP